MTCLFGSAALAGSPSVEGPPDKWWKEGPVRYLLSDQESERYARLESPEAREAFAERFWKRRDPDPATPENEARVRFHALCEEANREFGEGSRSGWSTDRGRVMILLGEPDAVRRDAGDARGRDREIWIYEHPPGGGAPIEVYFYRNAAGRFTLDPEGGGAVIGREDPVERQRERQMLRQQLRTENPRIPQAALEQLTDLLLASRDDSAFAAGADREPALRRGRNRSEPPSSEPLEAELDFAMFEEAFFFEAADGSVLVLLALEFQPPPSLADDEGAAAQSGPWEGRAWIVDDSGGIGALETPEPVDEIRLQASEGSGNGSLLFVGKAHLEPGSYGLRFSVQNRAQGVLMVRSEDLDVPEFGAGRFAASSLVPANHFGPAREGSASPFAVGSEEVIPRPGGQFRRGEPLRLYLQVYAAASDPESRRPRVDVRFRFLRKSRSAFRPHGKPLVIAGAEGASMGLALPVEDWPAGDYRVIVDLHDRISGSRIERSGSFSLAD